MKGLFRNTFNTSVTSFPPACHISQELISSTRLLAEEVSAENRVAQVIDAYTLSGDDSQENRWVLD